MLTAIERNNNNSFNMSLLYKPDKAYERVKIEITPKKLIICLLSNLPPLKCKYLRNIIEKSHIIINEIVDIVKKYETWFVEIYGIFHLPSSISLLNNIIIESDNAIQ